MNDHHNRDGILGGITGFLISIIRSFFTHIDWWAITQSVICAVICFFVVRILSHYFPKNEKE